MHSPVTIQTPKRIHVKYESFKIRNTLMNTDTSGSTGTPGTINGRGVLFWGKQRRSKVQIIRDNIINVNSNIAHHSAWDI